MRFNAKFRPNIQAFPAAQGLQRRFLLVEGLAELQFGGVG